MSQEPGERFAALQAEIARARGPRLSPEEQAKWDERYVVGGNSENGAQSNVVTLLHSANVEDELGPLLDAVVAFYRRFVIVSAEQADTLALWTLHTHAFLASDYTPYILITSPERESGKSRTMEIAHLLAAKAEPTANVSVAAVFRISAEDPPPTFLMDEIDMIFSPKSDRSELQGLLNAGFRRGQYVLRMVGEGSRMQVERFHVYCPKMLAGTSSARLADTLRSRCIIVQLKRKRKNELVERFRRRELEQEGGELAAAMRVLAERHLDTLDAARPELPDELSDRAQDVWEPLLAIAELAGGDWPQRGRTAAVALSASARVDDESLGVRLLWDCRAAFDSKDVDRFATRTLIETLCEDEEAPWATWHHGSPISPRKLATLLGRYDVHSRTVRLPGGETPKGYLREQFEDAWERYPAPVPPSLSATTPQPA